MANDLVDADELGEFPGAPFPQSRVDAAVSRLRKIAGWHIAPQLTETLTLDGSTTKLLVLPTLQLVDVVEIRDVSGTTPVVLGDWRAATAGLIKRRCGWPWGFRAVEVDVVHGYEETPPDLFDVVAGLCQLMLTDPEVAQESLGSWSVTTRDALGASRAEALEDYVLPRFK